MNSNAPTAPEAATDSENVTQFPSPENGDAPKMSPEMIEEMNRKFLDSPKIQAAMIDGAFQTGLLKGLTGENSVNIEKLLGNYKKWAEIEQLRGRDGNHAPKNTPAS